MAGENTKDEFLARFGLDTSDFLKKLKELEKRTGATLEAIDAVTTTTGIAFAGLAASIGVTTAKFAEFEKGLTGVRKTSNLSEEATKQLGDDILELSRATPVATSALLEIAEAAGQLGVKGTDNILAFTDTVSKLGTATDLQGAEAAKTLARILNVTGENIANVNALGSAFVRLGNDVAAGEAEIASVTGEIAKTTAVFKIGAANATALGASLAETGVQAEIGGSVIGRTFAQIKDTIDAGGESFTKLAKVTGVTTEQLKTQFDKDATGVFVRFLSAVNRVAESGGNVNQFLQQFGLNGAGVAKVIQPLATNVDGLQKNLRLAGEEFKNATALANEFNLFAGTTSARLDTAKKSVEEAAITFGEKFAPTVVSLTESLAGLINFFNQFDSSTLTFIARLAVTATAVTGAITAIGLLTKAFVTLRIAVIALGASTGPIGALVALLGVASAAVAAFYATAEDDTIAQGQALVKAQEANNDKLLDAVKKGGQELEDAELKSAKNITANLKAENQKRLDEIQKLHNKRQGLLERFDEEQLAQDKETALQQLELERANLELIQLQKNGASQDALNLKRSEIDTLKTLLDSQLENAKIAAKAEKTALEVITSEKNKEIIALEQEKLDKIRQDALESQELQEVDLGDFEERTRALIEDSFDKKLETQRTELAKIDKQLHDLSVKGSYPNQQKALQEDLEKKAELTTAYYDDERQKHQEFLNDIAAMTANTSSTSGTTSSGGGGTQQSKSYSTAYSQQAPVLSVPTMAPVITPIAPTPAPRTQTTNTSQPTQNVGRQDIKVLVGIEEDAVGFITAKQVERAKLGTL